MRFLIDSCIGGKVVAWLGQCGHDVAVVAEDGPDPGDAAILDRARIEGRILITADKDFGTLVHLHGAAHAGIVRMAHMRVERRLAWLAALLERHSAEEIESSIVTVRPSGIRIVRSRPRDELPH